MWSSPQETSDSFTFTIEVLKRKLHFTCSGGSFWNGSIQTLLIRLYHSIWTYLNFYALEIFDRISFPKILDFLLYTEQTTDLLWGNCVIYFLEKSENLNTFTFQSSSDWLLLKILQQTKAFKVDHKKDTRTVSVIVTWVSLWSAWNIFCNVCVIKSVMESAFSEAWSIYYKW